MADGVMPDWSELHGDHFRDVGVLVTGGAGFIGSQLVEALTALGARVTVLDDLSGGSMSNLEFPGGREVRFIHGSVLSPDALASAVDGGGGGCTYIFHQAALGSVPESVREPGRYHDVNSTGTMRVAEAARAGRVKRIMFASSASVYGEPVELPIHESLAVSPRSPYAATKVSGEAMLRAAAYSLGVDAVSLRYFNIFGPRQNPRSAYAAVIAAFADALLRGRRPVIYGSGEQSRDFTYVANVVHANLLAARGGEAGGNLMGETINVATGTRISVNELWRVAAELLDAEEFRPSHEAPRAGDVMHSLADIGTAKSLLGYQPLVGFRDGLRATLDWYRANLSG